MTWLRCFTGCLLFVAWLTTAWMFACSGDGLVRVVVEHPTSQPYFAVQPPASQPYAVLSAPQIVVPKGLVENTNDFSHLFNGSTKYVIGGLMLALLFAKPVYRWFK